MQLFYKNRISHWNLTKESLYFIGRHKHLCDICATHWWVRRVCCDVWSHIDRGTKVIFCFGFVGGYRPAPNHLRMIWRVPRMSTPQTVAIMSRLTVDPVLALSFGWQWDFPFAISTDSPVYFFGVLSVHSVSLISVDARCCSFHVVSFLAIHTL